MGFFLSLFFGFVPMILFASVVYWLDRYEKEPKVLLGGVFLWGAIAAAGGALLVNTVMGMGVYLFTQSEAATELTTGSLIAPIVEESLKGFAVLIVFLVFRNEFDSLLDGIVYAGVTALGFAATENVFYIYRYGYLEQGYSGLLWLVFVRVFLVGWQHPFYTAFTGIGLALARLSRPLWIKILTPMLGLITAMFFHSLHNTMASLIPAPGSLVVGTIVDWTGWLFMGLIIWWAAVREQQYLTRHLKEEMTLGLISPEQYLTACSAWSQATARIGALLSGHYLTTARFYQACAELAHKKQQRLALGEERGNSAIIESLRAELAGLAKQI